MAETTYLRYIRLKCGITLMELEEHSSFSNQYLSLLELGRANCTPRNAETLDRAMLDTLAVALLSTAVQSQECCHITVLPLSDAHDFFSAHSSDYASGNFYFGGWC